MKTVKTIDQHPGKWNDNIELFLVEAIATGIVDDEFITGFRVDPTQHKGMFDEYEEPVQGLDFEDCKDGFANFTMYNHTCLKTEQIKELREKKELYIEDKWEGQILSSLKLKVVE